MKVLIAEDEVVSRHLLQSYLQQWGHQVVAAPDGTAAWRMFQEQEFPLVLSDWVMPEMDGLELIRHIRSRPSGAYTYIILLTARTKKQDVIEGLEAGANDFVTKPFDRGELRVRVRAGERIVELEQALAAQNRTLREAQAALVQTEKLASLGQLAAGMAHEINNPLAYITNNLAVLRRDVPAALQVLDKYRDSREQLRRVAPEVVAEAECQEADIDLPYIRDSLPRLFERSLDGLARVRDIVKNLRDFARLDESDFKETDLNAALQSTLEIAAYEIKTKAIDLRTYFAELPPILCHPGKINQVFLNVLLNAVQASQQGGVIEVRTRPDDAAAGGGVIIEVQDTGGGIKSEHLPHIFDPFFTTKPVGQGTGLGLSVSYGIIRDHGGSIEAESEVGRGALFRIRLPLRPPPLVQRWRIQQARSASDGCFGPSLALRACWGMIGNNQHPALNLLLYWHSPQLGEKCRGRTSMPSRIEDYALIGDCETAALVGKDGSLDWLCLPRFDSGACFAALLGTPEQGRWQIVPAGEIRKVSRRYRDGTIILETTFETDEGVVTLIDGMAIRAEEPVLIRCVRGDRGQVLMKLHLVLRFDYGSIVPWVTQLEEGGIRAIAGPDTVFVRTHVPLHGENHSTVAEFTVAEGQEVPFLLSWRASYARDQRFGDPMKLLRKTERAWRKWSKGCDCSEPWGEQILRSLLTLKALTYAPTGGVVAAPTTSLPEQIGSVRNWDYRLCWIRDATFTLYALMAAGYKEEAHAWREWLLRAAAGNPDKLQIMYGLGGERRLMEWEVDWLPGYEDSRPVRVGNGAYQQFQLDVYGELLDAMYQSRRVGLPPKPAAWNLEKAIVTFLETAWKQPDEGIWEVRGPRRHFTHSKVMAWVAFDRAIKMVEKFEVEGPLDRWRTLRDAVHNEVCTQGFDTSKNSFVQYYGSTEPDASLLMVPLVGFLPADDPRAAGTVACIERELLHHGFVQRYKTHPDIDGLPPGEGVFLPCTFWLADNYVMLGRQKEAEKIFERLLGLCNDLGLISEEYDPSTGRLVGNFPQAFTHVGLINTAMNLRRQAGHPAEHRTT